jgi:hypothetical protein
MVLFSDLVWRCLVRRFIRECKDDLTYLNAKFWGKTSSCIRVNMLVTTLDDYANWQYWFVLYPQEPSKFSYQIFPFKFASDSTLEVIVSYINGVATELSPIPFCVITVHNGNLNTDVDTSFNLWTPIRMVQHNLFNFFLFNQIKCILLLN